MAQFVVRDLRKKDQYKIDDAYLNGYARLCGVYATAVYNSLSRHADFHTQECFPSIEKIAEQHSISKDSVIRGIKALLEWGIIAVHKEKDPKTKRQLPNVYTLADKSVWKPKPQSRVADKDSESRVDISVEPSRSQRQSRVADVDCKDTQFKDNTIKDTAETSSAGSKTRFNQLGAEILKAFEVVDPKNKTYYGNTTQRKACDFLIEEYGLEEVLKRIGVLPQTNKLPYMPKINTPHELKEKWIKLQDSLISKKSESKSNYVL